MPHQQQIDGRGMTLVDVHDEVAKLCALIWALDTNRANDDAIDKIVEAAERLLAGVSLELWLREREADTDAKNHII